jgi:hypothetical protein
MMQFIGGAQTNPSLEHRGNTMKRECSHCCRPFAARDFVKETSKSMEADRKRFGLDGVKFSYYLCPACGRADIFVDVHHQPGESFADFVQRKLALRAAAKKVHTEELDVVLCEQA